MDIFTDLIGYHGTFGGHFGSGRKGGRQRFPSLPSCGTGSEGTPRLRAYGNPETPAINFGPPAALDILEVGTGAPSPPASPLLSQTLLLPSMTRNADKGFLLVSPTRWCQTTPAELTVVYPTSVGLAPMNSFVALSAVCVCVLASGSRGSVVTRNINRNFLPPGKSSPFVLPSSTTPPVSLGSFQKGVPTGST